jgi:selenium-binding protein 1
MNARATATGLLVVALTFGLSGCEEDPSRVVTPEDPVAAQAVTMDVQPGADANAGGFQHGRILNVDGTDYYLAGAPDGPDGAFDIPGHYWVIGGSGQLSGKHYNTGPFGAPQWWSSDAPDGALLYVVHGVVDTWTAENAEAYARRGYVHYHELVTVEDGSLHPDKVVWLRHIARTSFTLDGGPHPELSHDVKPGVDLEFVPNGMMPYNP